MAVDSLEGMDLRFPEPLKPGDLVGITSPSAGVPTELRARLDVAVDVVRSHGFEVRIGECMDGAGIQSAPQALRAAEFQQMLLDPRVRAIVPPWGGDTAIDLLDLLDFEAIAAAEPTWVVGFSDISTLMTPLTLLSGWATVHGNNLLDTPYQPPDGVVGWLEIVSMSHGTSFAQNPPDFHRTGYVDYAQHPEVSTYDLDAAGTWCRLDDESDDLDVPDDLDVTGRLIGGCIETLSNLAGTRYFDPAPIAAQGEGLIVYLEAAEHEAAYICRNLHGMRLAGVFDNADAVLIGRTYAPDSPGFTQHDAVRDALGDLDIPILADVECGHWAPYMPLVNGALARVQHVLGDASGQGAVRRVTQYLR